MKMTSIISIIGLILIAVVVVAVILNLRSKIAISVPPFFTYINKDYRNDTETIAHEKCHWDQYERMGFFKFYGTYIKEQFGGYRNSPLENECYNLEV